jgi:very-short-patch-repair endonuclease
VTYSHPNYKVDFLLIYRDLTGEQHKIIIEYDGFKEHFGTSEHINEFNYGEYFSEGDIYREKVLESYGYKFLRINKFNSGEDPVKTLSERIQRLVSGSTGSNLLLDSIHQTVESLQNGEMRECPKCKEIREKEEFEDPSLMKGYGRICRLCKSLTRTVQRQKTAAAKPPVVLTDKLCPRCKSQMVLRKGRYGQFYGCKKFPYCRGTQPYQA